MADDIERVVANAIREVWFGVSLPQNAPTFAVMARTAIASMEGDGADWSSKAALYTLASADHPPPHRSPDGRAVEHAAWMLDQIVGGDISGRKAHRWLGYAQGLLVAAEWLTLEEAKLANKRASDEAAPPPTHSGDGE